MGNRIGDRAVVLGAGMAGLLSARVLSSHYHEVLVVDRDPLSEVDGARKGVPHGRHAHALLARGQQILEELFPGLLESMTADGVLVGDLAGNLRWYFNGQRLAAGHVGLLSVSATRPQLESYVRARVARIPNVSFVERCAIRGLVASGGRVTGARVLSSSSASSGEVLSADLVVDATGRGSRMPAWLEDLGYARPTEDRVKVDIGYATRHFRLRDDPYGTDLSINTTMSPSFPRGAFFPKLGGGISQLSLTGLLGDHPPTDHAGFLAFAKSLPAPEIYEAVRRAEPVDEAVRFRVAASVRRRYERLRSFPDGVLVIGDAVCAFNPVYGQGMTAAALQALALRDQLSRGAPSARRFFRAVAPLVDVPWQIATSGDLSFPAVEGDRTLMVRMGNGYMGKLHAAATRDPALTAAFFRVAGLVDPPTALMRPSVMLRVFRGGTAGEVVPVVDSVGREAA